MGRTFFLPRQSRRVVALALSLALIFAGDLLVVDEDEGFIGSALAAGGNDGSALYQRWCSACHGDRGQGLTEEWRSTWPQDKQNCWQSKCHASNHPPDGFIFPKTVPALIGNDTLTKFSTAQDLYVYTRATMPFWAPNLLSDEDYLAIATFLVEANFAEKGLPSPTPLPQDLAAVSLHPAPELGELAFSFTGIFLVVFGILAALIVGGCIKRQSNKGAG